MQCGGFDRVAKSNPIYDVGTIWKSWSCETGWASCPIILLLYLSWFYHTATVILIWLQTRINMNSTSTASVFLEFWGCLISWWIENNMCFPKIYVTFCFAHEGSVPSLKWYIEPFERLTPIAKAMLLNRFATLSTERLHSLLIFWTIWQPQCRVMAIRFVVPSGAV